MGDLLFVHVKYRLFRGYDNCTKNAVTVAMGYKVLLCIDIACNS